jgi:hypothetical protein
MQKKIKRKTENIHKKGNNRSDLDYLFPGNGARKRGLLTVYIRIIWICKWTNPPS